MQGLRTGFAALGLGFRASRLRFQGSEKYGFGMRER